MNNAVRGNRINLRPAVVIAVAVACGILLSFSVFVRKVSFVLPCVFAAVFTAVLFLLKFKGRLRELRIFALACLFFAGGFFSFYGVYERYYVSSPSFRDVTVKLTSNDINGSSGYVSGFFSGKIVTEEGEIPLDGKVKAEFYSGATELPVGQSVIFILKGRLYRLSPFYNGGVDSELIANGVRYALKTDEILSHGTIKPSFTASVRNYVTQTIEKYSSSQKGSALLSAIILGEKGGLSAETKNDYRTTGLAHIFSVSGLHVGFASAVSAWIFDKLFKKNKRLGFLLSLIPIWFYVWICGFAPSSVRAAIMASAVTIARPYRRIDVLSSLCYAGAVLFLFSPDSLFSGGCLMSFSAVFGIISLSSACRNLKEKIKSRRMRGLFDAFVVSVGASLGTLPFVWSYYGEISLLSLPVNIFAVFTLSLAFVMTVICLIPLLNALIALSSAIVSVTDAVVSAASEVGTISLPSVSCEFLIFLAFAVILIALCGKIKSGGKIKLIAVTSALFAVCLTPLLFPAFPTETAFYKRESVAFLTTDRGEVFVFADIKNEYDVYGLKKALRGVEKGRIFLIADTLPMCFSVEGLHGLINEMNIEGVISADMRETDARLFFERCGVKILSEYKSGGGSVTAKKIQGKNCAVIETNGFVIVFMRDGKTVDFDKFAPETGKIDFLYAKRIAEDNLPYLCTALTDSAVCGGKCFSSVFDLDFTFYPQRCIIKGR